MQKLTQKQQVVYDFICEYMSANGMPPTRAEIADGLGFKSPNAAEEHIRSLAKKEAITVIKGASRGIRLCSEGEQALEAQEATNDGLPVIGRVAAGSPILATEHVEQHCAIAPDFFQPKADYLLKVQGTSMKNVGIYEGDLVAVHRTQSVRNGDIIVARVDDDVTLKRFERTPQGIHLKAENEEFSDIVVQPDQEFNIEGLYVGVIRRH